MSGAAPCLRTLTKKGEAKSLNRGLCEVARRRQLLPEQRLDVHRWVADGCGSRLGVPATHAAATPPRLEVPAIHEVGAPLRVKYISRDADDHTIQVRGHGSTRGLGRRVPWGAREAGKGGEGARGDPNAGREATHDEDPRAGRGSRFGVPASTAAATPLRLEVPAIHEVGAPLRVKYPPQRCRRPRHLG